MFYPARWADRRSDDILRAFMGTIVPFQSEEHLPDDNGYPANILSRIR